MLGLLDSHADSHADSFPEASRALRTATASRGLRIGIFGGTFNPAHEGHYALALTALRRLRLERAWWVTSRRPPHKASSSLAPFEERDASARRMASRHPHMLAPPLEAAFGDVESASELLERLRRVLVRARAVWLMGADSCASLHRWKHWTRLPDTLPIAVVARPGHIHAALRSPFAERYRRARVPQESAALLPSLRPPAWSFVFGATRVESGEAIRRRARESGRLGDED